MNDQAVLQCADRCTWCAGTAGTRIGRRRRICPTARGMEALAAAEVVCVGTTHVLHDSGNGLTTPTPDYAPTCLRSVLRFTLNRLPNNETVGEVR